jgi:hypothetical protein
MAFDLTLGHDCFNGTHLTYASDGAEPLYGFGGQCLIGSESMMGPVLAPGADQGVVYLPTGGRVHPWRGAPYEAGPAGLAGTVAATPGEPLCSTKTARRWSPNSYAICERPGCSTRVLGADDEARTDQSLGPGHL